MFLFGDKGEWLIIEHDPRVLDVMPDLFSFEDEGKRWLRVPNGRDETKVLRNLGIPAPPPIFTRFDWSGTVPWETQKLTAALLTENRAAYVLNGLGTGKTFSTLMAAEYLLDEGLAHKVLVIAPLSILERVWSVEIFLRTPHRKSTILHGTKAQRQAAFAKDVTYYIINHHGLNVMLDELRAFQFDIIVVDELAVFRNRATELWKRLNLLVSDVRARRGYTWGLTAAPTPNAPTDAYGQVKLLTPQRVPMSFYSVRDQLMIRHGMIWLPKKDATENVHKLMQPSVRFSLDDVAELPETTYVTRLIEPTEQIKQAYKSLRDDCFIQFKSGQVTALNEGVLRIKLLQASCGWIYKDVKPDGTQDYEHLDNTPRLEALFEEVEAADGKVIVFVPYKHALRGIADYLKGHGRRVAVVSGDVSMRRRSDIFAAFQDDPWGIDTLVAHPACMAHGLTLTAASTIVWFSPHDNYEQYEQANGRVRRPGQIRRTRVVNFVSTPIERAVVRRNNGKEKLQINLLDMFGAQELTFT